MARKKFSFTDYAWLRMDEPDNLMIITGLMTFDKPLDYERLRGLVENSLLRFRRFRQRIAPPRPPFMRPSWEDDPNFNLDNHLVRVQLAEPADQGALQDFISTLMSTPLEYNRPLWKFYLVENYGPGGAFVSRLHHSIADGVALMQVLLSMAEAEGNPPAESATQAAGQTGAAATNGPVKTRHSDVLSSSKLSAEELWEEGIKILTDPSHARQRTRQAMEVIAAMGKLALRWPDPKTVFKGPLGVEKRAAWSEPLALAAVKSVGKAFNSTVNDVLLSAVAGALGRYIQARGGGTAGLSIRGFIPVNLRPIELDEELGNKFGLVFLSLPIGITDPVERLHRVRRNMNELKSSAEPIAAFGVINLMGAVPPWLEQIVVDFFDTKGTSVMTNVPGTQAQLSLAGSPINTVMAWVPQTGRIALGVSIISYNGKVWLGIATDKGLVPDPEAIIGFFQAEFEALSLRAQSVPEERRKELKELLAMLEEANQTLDAILEESRGDQADLS
jgi:WS/DGAT/MGAT family acyltransferase